MSIDVVKIFRYRDEFSRQLLVPVEENVNILMKPVGQTVGG